jgi:hypothetical protein
LLEHHPELLPHAKQLALGKLRDVLAVDHDRSRLRTHEAADRSEQGALARAAAAEDHRDAIAREPTREVAQNLAVSERDAHVRQRDVDRVRGGRERHA